MTNKRIPLKPIAFLLLLAALSACGTIDGIGRDISGASNRVADML
ncbi:MAG: entericidin EcnA/B family protein [Pseudorhodobacter sp.]|jgi:predicted small secreted protein